MTAESRGSQERKDRQTPLFANATGLQICVVVLLAAAVCGAMATRRGSRWWSLTVVPANYLDLVKPIVAFYPDLDPGRDRSGSNQGEG